MTLPALLLIAILGSPWIGADVFAAPSDKQTQRTASSGITDNTAVLQAQLDVMRDYTKHLLSTVYWSLGVIVTIVVLLIGFGWFANFKVYERDKIALQQQLHGHLQEEISTLNRTLTENIQKRHAEVMNESRSAVKAAVEGLENRLKISISTVADELKVL